MAASVLTWTVADVEGLRSGAAGGVGLGAMCRLGLDVVSSVGSIVLGKPPCMLESWRSGMAAGRSHMMSNGLWLYRAHCTSFGMIPLESRNPDGWYVPTFDLEIVKSLQKTVEHNTYCFWKI